METKMNSSVEPVLQSNRETHSMLCRTSTSWVFWSGAMRANTEALSTSCSAPMWLQKVPQRQKRHQYKLHLCDSESDWVWYVQSLYLLDELREVLRDNSEGSATHSKVIHALIQVYLHSLEEKMSHTLPKQKTEKHTDLIFLFFTFVDVFLLCSSDCWYSGIQFFGSDTHMPEPAAIITL